MEKLLKLRNDIARHQSIYYNGGENPVSDATYDGWIRELTALSPDDPLLKAVGAPVPADSALQKVKHKHHMGSLNNAMTEEEFLEWHEKMTAAHVEANSADEDRGKPLLYNVSFKMDGASAEGCYSDGVFAQGSTRGDGQFGEDISANMLRMKGVPRYVSWPDGTPFTGFVRGEIMLFNEEWKRLDPDQLSNPRNLGNGMARRKDGEGCENLRFIAFRGFGSDGEPLGTTETWMNSNLRDLGFDPVSTFDPPMARTASEHVLEVHRWMNAPLQNDLGEVRNIIVGIPSIFDKLKKGDIPRDELPFEIDGIVVKLDDFKLQGLLGESNNRPKGQIAFKFPPRGAKTLIKDVEWTVGHTGAIIPTAILEPVRIGGVTVSRALLCNMEEIARLGVGIGFEVEVVRAGDVIPKVIRATGGVTKDSRRIFAPTECPGCGGPVGKRKGVKGDEGVHLFCLGDNCSAQALGKIKTWIKKLDIQGLGDVYIEALFNTRWVSDGQRIVGTPADLYKLRSAKFEYLMSGHSTIISPKLVTKILDEIDKKRELTLSDFLGSLGIDGLGRRRVVLVQQALPGEFETLTDWTSGKLVKMAKEAGLPNAAAGIYAQINSAKSLIDELLAAGVKVADKPKEDTAQKPMAKTTETLVFCLTGKFPDHPKAWYHDKITAAGHRYEESYRKGLSFLVASDPASGSSKMVKAEKDGVPVISDAKLLAMLAQ